MSAPRVAVSVAVLIVVVGGAAVLTRWISDDREMGERYEVFEERIDALLPKGPGIQAVPQPQAETEPRIVVRLVREKADDPAEAFTRIVVGERQTFDLPKGDFDPDDPEGDEARLSIYDPIFEQVAAAIGECWAASGNDPAVRAEISIPRPKGLDVPHGDVIRVLDTFIQAGILNVVFKGAPSPPPRGR